MPTRTVSLAELFEDGKDTLFLYSFMFIPGDSWRPLEVGCPACTSIIDALDGRGPHITQRVNLAIAAKAPIQQFREHALSRGWRNIRLLSSAEYDLQQRLPQRDGRRQPAPDRERIRAKRRSGSTTSGAVSLPSLRTDPEQHPRHVDFMWPLWNVLDLTPEGRGSDWHPRLEYS